METTQSVDINNSPLWLAFRPQGTAHEANLTNTDSPFDLLQLWLGIKVKIANGISPTQPTWTAFAWKNQKVEGMLRGNFQLKGS